MSQSKSNSESKKIKLKHIQLEEKSGRTTTDIYQKVKEEKNRNRRENEEIRQGSKITRSRQQIERKIQFENILRNRIKKEGKISSFFLFSKIISKIQDMLKNETVQLRELGWSGKKSIGTWRRKREDGRQYMGGQRDNGWTTHEFLRNGTNPA